MEVAPSSSSGGGDGVGSAIDVTLSAAGSLVDRHILLNNEYLDLAGLLGVASHLAPAVSGLQVFVAQFECLSLTFHAYRSFMLIAIRAR